MNISPAPLIKEHKTRTLVSMSVAIALSVSISHAAETTTTAATTTASATSTATASTTTSSTATTLPITLTQNLSTEEAGRNVTSQEELDGSEDNQALEDYLLQPDLLIRPLADPSLVADRNARLDISNPDDELLALHKQAVSKLRNKLGDRQEQHNLQLISAKVDRFGNLHAKYQHTYKGVRVVGSAIGGHVITDPASGAAETSMSFNALTQMGSKDFNVSAKVALDKAISIARNDFNLHGANNVSLTLSEQAELTLLPSTSLVSADGRPINSNANRDDLVKVLDSLPLVYQVTIQPEQATVMLQLTGDINQESEIESRVRDSAVLGPVTEAEESLAAESLPNSASVDWLSPELSRVYWVDANSGKIISSRTMVDHNLKDDLMPVEGTGWGYFSGKKTLHTLHYTPQDYFVLSDRRLVSVDRPLGNTVWDAHHVDTHDDWTRMLDNNNNWGDGSIIDTETAGNNTNRRQTPGVDVAYGMELTTQMYHNVFARKNIDDKGTPQNAVVHSGDGYADAHYSTSTKFIVFGDGSSTVNAGNYSLSTVGHELGHAVWRSEGIIDNNSGESDAINEGNGDVSGSFASFYATGPQGSGSWIYRLPGQSNWTSRVRKPESYFEQDLSNEDCDITGLDADDINRDTVPECYDPGFRYWDLTLKNNPSHVGGIPYGRAVMHLAEGGSNDVDADTYSLFFPDGFGGLGYYKASHIWYTAMTTYIQGEPDYLALRDAFVEAALYLYGNGLESQATKNAFRAVNVGRKATDIAAPTMSFAKVWGINSEELTAVAYAQVDDDTGIKSLKVTANGSSTSLLPQDVYQSYISLMSTTPGQSVPVTFSLKDNANNVKNVTRYINLPRNRQLLVNGDFENNNGWISTLGVNHYLRNYPEYAFTGSDYLKIKGSDVVYQDVVLPDNATDITLTYRISLSPSIKDSDSLGVQLRTPQNNLLKTLDIFSKNTDVSEMHYANGGYLKRKHNLSEYAGQSVRLAFAQVVADDSRRFQIDHVTLTWESDPFIEAPDVIARPWENTLTFSKPNISGINSSEILRVDYYVNGVYATSATKTNNPFWSATAFINKIENLKNLSNTVVAIVRDLNNNAVAVSPSRAFSVIPVQELITNGTFETGLSHWPYSSGDIMNVNILQASLDYSPQFDGYKSLALGGAAAVTETALAQLVSIPQNPMLLAFSARIRIDSDHDVYNQNIPMDQIDKLYLDVFSDGGLLIDSFPLATEDQARFQSKPYYHDSFNNYIRAEVNLNPIAAYAGKNVYIKLRVEENDNVESRFRIDNVSLRAVSLKLAKI